MRKLIFLRIKLINKKKQKLKAPCTRFSPCKNSGTCSNTLVGPDYWSCDCSSTYGFNGTNCELRKFSMRGLGLGLGKTI
jgi:hypothetical protein